MPGVSTAVAHCKGTWRSGWVFGGMTVYQPRELMIGFTGQEHRRLTVPLMRSTNTAKSYMWTSGHVRHRYWYWWSVPVCSNSPAVLTFISIYGNPLIYIACDRINQKRRSYVPVLAILCDGLNFEYRFYDAADNSVHSSGVTVWMIANEIDDSMELLISLVVSPSLASRYFNWLTIINSDGKTPRLVLDGTSQCHSRILCKYVAEKHLSTDKWSSSGCCRSSTFIACKQCWQSTIFKWAQY